jgi:hypothetical protein
MKNYHSARITDPSRYTDWAYSKDKGGAGVDFVYGIRVKDGKRTSELQAVRFDRGRFTIDRVRAWLKRNRQKAVRVEPAKAPRKPDKESFEAGEGEAGDSGLLLVEDYVCRPEGLEIDHEQRTVRNLPLLGEHSRNGYDYDRAAMKQAVADGLYDGVVLVDQHKGGDRSMDGKFGATFNARYCEEADGVARIRADAHVFRGDAGDTFLGLCEFAPASAGLSHEAKADWAKAA